MSAAGQTDGAANTASPAPRGVKVAVLGAGNLGQAQAAHLALNGYDVTLGNRSRKTVQPIIDAGNRIELFGKVVAGTARLTFVGDESEFAEVLRDRELVIVAVPATAQRHVLARALPHLGPRAAHLVLHPGQLFGAFAARKQLDEHSAELSARVTVSEIESSQLTCRAAAPGRVEVFAIKARLGIASMPADRVSEVVALYSPLYADTLVPRRSVLSTGWNDFNLVVHPINTLLNCSAIERGASFLYYKEGVSPSVGRLLERADAERMAVGRRLGIEDLESLRDWVRDEYGPLGAAGDTVHELITSNPAFATLRSPDHLYSRYIWEDVPDGLIGMIELGRQLGVPTPTLDCVYRLACLMFDRDWQDEARTCASLGLGGLSAPELLEYAVTGRRRPA